ncbi:hypothetical protein [Actinophytocola sp.]|uniref:hypothetical protein n=1 Tax=Actinophytocola sp. TaxID=1872138 RepID=UPI002D7EBFFD|nr:hypothetical protein [Actinophytocola sp.]HET9141801.1 hypothetical protein [Actinophytocola sp.]
MSSERGFLQTTKVVLIAVISWVVLNIVSELIGNQANETAFGQVVGRYVLLVAVFGVPLAALGWVVLYLRDRREELDDNATRTGGEWPAARLPAPWRPPDPLYDRDSEVDRAVQVAQAQGVVLVAGPRDIGTSAVAETMVQRLIDAGLATPGRTVRLDLRSRSSRRPDDARAAAARVVSEFGVDEPADGTPGLLADAGYRLVATLRDDYDVLMLDNASGPEEVEWLVGSWPGGGPPWLVVAGESAILRTREPATVLVGELGLHGLRAMWRAELPEPGSPAKARRMVERWVRRFGGVRREDLDTLLLACFGRPGVLKAFIREVGRPDSTVSITGVVAAAASPGSRDSVLERIWTGMLDRVRAGLPDDAVWLLHALAELPVTALTRGAVVGMLAGYPGEPAGRDPLEELRIRNLVRDADGRYRFPREVRRAVAATTDDDVRRDYARQAIPALVRYYAVETSGRAADLGSGRAAGDWFHDVERSVRPLFTTESYQDERLCLLVLDDLAVIAEALEGWYVREQQADGLLKVNTALHVLAERSGRADLACAAAIRMAAAHRIAGRLSEAGSKLDVAAETADASAEQFTELGVREHVERALLALSRPRPDRSDLTTAEAELNRILANHRDHRGATAARLNLAALCLRLNRPHDALDHLDQAERLAKERHDLGCRAHAVELRGIALAGQDDRLLDAVAAWRLAEHYFEVIGEEQGQSRCLQHLAAAALKDGRAAAQIRADLPAVRVAQDLLARAEKLRAGQPETPVLRHYLDEVEKRLADEPPGGAPRSG